MDLFSYGETNRHEKCAIIGCGRTGGAIACSLAQTGVFGEIVLLDVDFEKAEGEAADVAGGLSHRLQVDVYAGDYSDLCDCSLIVLCVGTHAEILETDAEAFRKKLRMIRSVGKKLHLCSSSAVLLVVSSPVDRLSYLVAAESGFPKERVLGLGTLLDSMRLSNLLGMHLGVNPSEISAFIIGEHGENEFPVWSHANVKGIPLPCYYELCGRIYDRVFLDGLFFDVRDSAKKIMTSKGNAAFAIAQAVKRIALSIAGDEKRILPVSTYLAGMYGLENTYLSLPAVIGKGGVRQVLEIPLDHEEEERLRRSVKQSQRALEQILSGDLHV